jgi:branched-chain amino acid transport system substrate-binding protein
MPQFHSHGSATPKFLELAGEAADGVKMPALKILKPELLSVNDPQKKLLLTYKKEYEEKFKKTVSPFGANGWDSFTLAVEALKAVGPDRQKIRDFIENKKNFIGIAGIFNFSPQDHNGLDAETALMFVEVKKGQWILYESGS